MLLLHSLPRCDIKLRTGPCDSTRSKTVHARTREAGVGEGAAQGTAEETGVSSTYLLYLNAKSWRTGHVHERDRYVNLEAATTTALDSNVHLPLYTFYVFLLGVLEPEAIFPRVSHEILFQLCS